MLSGTNKIFQREIKKEGNIEVLTIKKQIKNNEYNVFNDNNQDNNTIKVNRSIQKAKLGNKTKSANIFEMKNMNNISIMKI